LAEFWLAMIAGALIAVLLVRINARNLLFHLARRIH
jgi:hypothetical protein